MALLTYSAPPSKGSTVTVTLDKALLLSLNVVTSDPWWANDFDITQAIVTLKSVPGNGKRILAFDFGQSPCNDSLSIPIFSRDVFQVSKIVLIDTMGDKLSLDRTALLAEIPTLSESEISISNMLFIAAGFTYGLNNSPTIWINNAPTILSTPNDHGQIGVNCIAVSGGSVYVGGAGQLPTGNWLAAMWVDGTPSLLPLSTDEYSIATDMIAVGSDVYTCGYRKPAGSPTSIGCVWKNGALDHHIVDPYPGEPGYAPQGESGRIAVSGADVYVSMRIYRPTFPHYRAAVFKNGVMMYELPSEYGGQTYPSSICIDGSDIYVGGYTDSNDGHSVQRAVVWKNGAHWYYPSPVAQFYSSVQSIAISNGNLYAGGNDQTNWSLDTSSPFFSTAALDGSSAPTKTSLDLTGCVFGVLYDMAVSGSNVYTCGMSFNGTNNLPASWLNGTLTLMPTAPSSSLPTSITISGTDVYYAGNSATWKNLEGAVELPPAIFYSSLGSVNDVTTDGTSVLAVGNAYMVSTNTQVPCYWLDGIRVDLDTNSSQSQIYGGTFVGPSSDIHIVGADYASNQPLYWVNGVLTPLEMVDYFGDAKHITADSAGNVYIIGQQWGSGNICSLWTNGAHSEIALPEGFWLEELNDIAVLDDGTVYVAMSIGDNATGLILPVIWLDGTYSFLDTTGYDNGGYVTGITANNGNIYVSGCVYDLDWMQHPAGWMNGTLTVLSGIDGVDYVGYDAASVSYKENNLFLCGTTHDQATTGEDLPCVWKNGNFSTLALPPNKFGGYLVSCTIK